MGIAGKDSSVVYCVMVTPVTYTQEGISPVGSEGLSAFSDRERRQDRISKPNTDQTALVSAFNTDQTCMYARTHCPHTHTCLYAYTHTHTQLDGQHQMLESTMYRLQFTFHCVFGCCIPVLQPRVIPVSG